MYVLPIFCGVSVFVFFWYALLCVLSSKSIRGRESLLLFLRMSWYCIYSVAFLTVPRVGLQCVIVVLPDHTYLLFFIQLQTFKNTHSYTLYIHVFYSGLYIHVFCSGLQSHS